MGFWAAVAFGASAAATVYSADRQRQATNTATDRARENAQQPSRTGR